VKIFIRALLLTAASSFLLPGNSANADDEYVATALVTGGNRGLGLVWVEKYAERDWHVIATARRPEAADALVELGKKYPRIRIEQLDITVPESVDALGDRLEGHPVDFLINNAGMLGEEEGQRFSELDPSQFDTFMRVNALGALLVTERLLPNVVASRHRKIAGISARAASFAAYPRMHRGLYYYKASKVALNMILRNIALETGAQGVSVAVLSPGVVNTYGTEMNTAGMSPEMRSAMVDIDTSVSGMMKVMDDLTVAGSGLWYRFSGDLIDW
jgi:NAD(P)-dependent dehydrogenase (short-subunit alcohol dehydrogenase family)